MVEAGGEVERYLKQVEINAGHINEEIANFSQSFRGNKQTEELLSLVAERRSGLSPLHLGLLVYASYKYAYFEGNGRGVDSQLWDEIIEQGNNGHREILLDCVLRKNVNITNPYRYRALAYAAGLVLGDKTVSVADIGCGFYPFGVGYVGDGFVPVWEDGREIFLSDRQSVIEAVDLQVPDPVWAAACQWEPIEQMEETKGRYKKLLAESRVKFIQADITESVSKIEPVKVVYCANLLYQIPTELRGRVWNNIQSIVCSGGIILTADFLAGGSRRRPFTYAIKAYGLDEGWDYSCGKTIVLLENADCQKMRRT